MVQKCSHDTYEFSCCFFYCCCCCCCSSSKIQPKQRHYLKKSKKTSTVESFATELLSSCCCFVFGCMRFQQHSTVKRAKWHRATSAISSKCMRRRKGTDNDVHVFLQSWSFGLVIRKIVCLCNVSFYVFVLLLLLLFVFLLLG